MALVGDSQRDRAVRLLQRAYADAYLEAPELDRRLELALRARTASQLGMSVRGVPGALSELVIGGIAAPAVRHATFPIRLRVARLLLRVALGGWALATAVLAIVAAVSAATAGLSFAVGVALALLWLAASGAAYGISRSARRLSQP